MRAGGTWLAMNKSGNLAAVTNIRASAVQLNAKSRGHLPVDFLKSPQTNQAFMRGLQAQEINYNGFNFLTRKGSAFLHFNNQLGIINQVPAGMHGLRNASLNTSWPKLDQLKPRFKASIDKNIDNVTLLDLMMDKQMAEDKFLSETEITQEMERALFYFYQFANIWYSKYDLNHQRQRGCGRPDRNYPSSQTKGQSKAF